MALHRRELLRLLLLAPAGLAAAGAIRTIEAAIATAAPGLRPIAAGTSATRCAACGATGHGMLDPGCPARPRVI